MKIGSLKYSFKPWISIASWMAIFFFSTQPLYAMPTGGAYEDTSTTNNNNNDFIAPAPVDTPIIYGTSTQTNTNNYYYDSSAVSSVFNNPAPVQEPLPIYSGYSTDTSSFSYSADMYTNTFQPTEAYNLQPYTQNENPAAYTNIFVDPPNSYTSTLPEIPGVNNQASQPPILDTGAYAALSVPNPESYFQDLDSASLTNIGSNPTNYLSSALVSPTPAEPATAEQRGWWSRLVRGVSRGALETVDYLALGLVPVARITGDESAGYTFGQTLPGRLVNGAVNTLGHVAITADTVVGVIPTGVVAWPDCALAQLGRLDIPAAGRTIFGLGRDNTLGGIVNTAGSVVNVFSNDSLAGSLLEGFTTLPPPLKLLASAAGSPVTLGASLLSELRSGVTRWQEARITSAQAEFERNRVEATRAQIENLRRIVIQGE